MDYQQHSPTPHELLEAKNKEYLDQFVSRYKGIVTDQFHAAGDYDSFLKNRMGEQRTSVFINMLFFGTCFWLFTLRGRSVFWNIVLIVLAIVIYFIVHNGWEQLKDFCSEYVIRSYKQPQIVRTFITEQATEDISRINKKLSEAVRYEFPMETIAELTDELNTAISFYNYALKNASPSMFER